MNLKKRNPRLLGSLAGDPQTGGGITAREDQAGLMGVFKEWLRDMELTCGTGYEVLAGDPALPAEDVVHDSRKAADRTVFVALKGSRVDAHRFVPDVIARGCRCIVVERSLRELGYCIPEAGKSRAGERGTVPGDLAPDAGGNASGCAAVNTGAAGSGEVISGTAAADSAPSGTPRVLPGGVCIVRTADTARALAALSSVRFGHPSRRLKMIGITGTKGKTSSSYMMKTVLEECGHTVGVIGTNGCVIKDEHFDTVNTTPDSYTLNSYFRKMCDAGCDTVVMECSSQGFKLDRTAGILFDYGIFLNISPDHIGPLEHADFDEYLYCKSRLLTQCRTAVVNIDDVHIWRVLREAENSPWHRYERLLTFSLKDERASIYAYDLEFIANADFAGTVFRTKGNAEDMFGLSVPGAFNVDNALPVLAVACDMGLDMAAVKKALKKIHVEGRMEAVYKSDEFTCIVDYAHNETSMVNLLRTLRSYEPGRLVVVFGCGGNRSKDRRTGMAGAAARYADFSIFTSDNSRFEKPEAIIDDIERAYLEAGGDAGAYIRITDRSAAIRYAMEHAVKGDMIAVIGKGHEAYQEENGVRRHFLDKEEILKVRDELGL